MADEVRDVATGLWIWRIGHPDWHPDAGWEPPVTSTCVESGGEVALLDPIAPPDESEVWARLDANPPTLVVILKPDHVRDVDLFVRRYDTRAFGPFLFWPGDRHETELEGIEPAPSSRAASSPSTTAGDTTRHRSGCRSSGPSSSPTR